ncbi:hypothetical protein BC828DRAFT_394535 [Blastocladiella britannica]|nr:hypothetical protein BC828DRAFT_394535 [Blastocladiella britannica]
MHIPPISAIIPTGTPTATTGSTTTSTTASATAAFVTASSPAEPNSSGNGSSNNVATTVGIAAVGAVVAVTVAVLLHARRNNTLLKRYATAKDLPDSVRKGGGGGARPLRLTGYAVSVGDCDGFRFFHAPALRWYARTDLPTSRNTADTISVRIAGTDCPEAAHFGNPPQPWSYEAYEYTLTRLMPGSVMKTDSTKFMRGGTASASSSSSSSGPLMAPTPAKKTPAGSPGAAVLGAPGLVRLEIYRKDQYERVVAMAFYRPYPRMLPFYWRNLSLDLLREGLGVVYRQSGAEYGGEEAKFNSLQEAAKRGRRGVWSDPDFVPPAEYKKAHRATTEAATAS